MADIISRRSAGSLVCLSVCQRERARNVRSGFERFFEGLESEGILFYESFCQSGYPSNCLLRFVLGWLDIFGDFALWKINDRLWGRKNSKYGNWSSSRDLSKNDFFWVVFTLEGKFCCRFASPSTPRTARHNWRWEEVRWETRQVYTDSGEEHAAKRVSRRELITLTRQLTECQCQMWLSTLDCWTLLQGATHGTLDCS